MNLLPRIAILLLFISSSAISLKAQKVLIEEEVTIKTEAETFGPNRKHYRHIYSGFGFVTNIAAYNGADIFTGKSWEYSYGLRYKRRFNQVFSGGVELWVSRLSYHITQNDSKQVPDAMLHDKEKFVILQPGLGLYQRINFDNYRGNYIGRFIDLGAWGSWHGNFRHITRTTLDGETTRIRKSGMSYYEPFGYGLLVRVGLNNVVLKGSYRLSDIFKAEEQIPELPRFSFGIEFGVHPL